MSQHIASQEDQSATFIELFFDLVFVFAITQLVGLFHDGITWALVGQGVLIFWLIWWAWTQFTWTLNPADTTHVFIEFATLLSTATAFVMAVALPDAFTEKALWFAVPYVIVRLIGLWVYKRVTDHDEHAYAAVRRFAALSFGGMSAVLLGAFLGGTAQIVLWSLAVLLDVRAAWISGGQPGGGIDLGPERDAWGLHPEHFTERHGLITIIALGETLIVAATGLSGTEFAFHLAFLGFFVVACTCALWWTYFVRAKPVLDEAMECEPSTRARLARDAYSFLHFVMIAGVIAFAIAIEEAVLHPDHGLPLPGRISLALGIVLFVGGMAAAGYRATGRVWGVRLVVVAITAAVIIAVPTEIAATPFGFLFAGLLVIIFAEQRSKALDTAH